jgi:hypothetical protein
MRTRKRNRDYGIFKSEGRVAVPSTLLVQSPESISLVVVVVVVVKVVNLLLIYVLTEKPEGQLQSEHEQ